MRMLNKNRKGVSEVVANVLIVLLVIVVIAVILSVVKPTIERTADTVQSDCFTVQVEPQSCTSVAAVPAGTSGTCSTSGAVCVGAGQSSCPTGETCSGTGASVATPASKNVVVKRNPGAGNFEDIEAVFSDGSQTERESLGITSTGPNALDELETTSKNILSSALTTVTSPTNVNVVL